MTFSGPLSLRRAILFAPLAHRGAGPVRYAPGPDAYSRRAMRAPVISLAVVSLGAMFPQVMAIQQGLLHADQAGSELLGK